MRPVAENKKATVGREAGPIAAAYRSAEPGTSLVAYRSNPSSVIHKTERFETHLPFNRVTSSPLC
jgi:hypothetical protein